MTGTCSATCGGTCPGSGVFICPNTDNGAPGAPTIISPIGTLANPAPISGIAPQSVPLSWTTVAKADRYVVGLYNSSGSLIWNPSTMTTGSTTTPSYAAGVYYWRVRAINDTCSVGQTSLPSTTEYFRINSQPTIVRIMVADSDGHAVANDNTTDNHICKTDFIESTNPKEVVFGIFINDPDGVGDSGSPPILHWNGQNYPSTWTGVSGGNSAAQARVDYASYVGASPQSLHEVTATYSDRWGSAASNNDPSLPTTRLRWKVWDCKVLTSGKIYDGSAGQSCPSNGFTLMADDKLGFSSLTFSPDVIAMPTPPSSYGQANLIWTESYLPLFNGGNSSNPDGDLAATSRFTRLIDLGTGETHCSELGFNIPVGVASLVSPYSSNPSAQIDFSFIRDQEAWYQVMGAGVKGKDGVQSGVPVTATNKTLTLLGTYTDNGLVSSNVLMNNINGCSDDCVWGIPNNWYINQSTNDLNSYSYNYFYNNFFVKAGVGVTGTNWEEKPIGGGIYLVKNSLNIDENFILANPNNETMMVIVNGDITVQPEVTQLDGIYVASGNISVGGTYTSEININGMLYASRNISLSRSFTDKADNNKNPAVKVNYSPGLIFNLPPKIMRILSGWREE